MFQPETSRSRTAAQYDAELAELVAAYQPDWIVLAGWMLVLSLGLSAPLSGPGGQPAPGAARHVPRHRRHPAGLRGLPRGEIQHTGVMLHLVPDEGVDAGPVLAQEVVPIHAGDTLEMLEARVHAVEHRLLISTLKTLWRDKIEVRRFLCPHSIIPSPPKSLLVSLVTAAAWYWPMLSPTVNPPQSWLP